MAISTLRVALSTDGVSIWSPDIFGDAEPSRLREFLARAFAVDEVQGVELERAKSFGRIRYVARANPAQVWKKLSRVLGSASESARVDAGVVYLDGRGQTSVRIARVGDFLSSWRVHHQTESTLHLGHPALRNRRDVVFRLEEELAALLGVEDFKASALTAGVTIRFDGRITTPERITRELEKAWPRLLEGIDGVPSRTRLVAAVGLAGLAFAGQYVAPTVAPIALLGMTLYSSPNVVKAAKQLARGQVGTSALYSTGVAFMLTSGSAVASSVMAVLMQTWPHLAREKIVKSQRRLFAGHRRHASWVRALDVNGVEVGLSADELHEDSRIVVRSGDTIPVDGVVEHGLAAIQGETPFGGRELEERSPGDAVVAGGLVRAGSLTIRVERAGARTAASYVASLLPHGPFAELPSSLAAERVADRNAKPVIALSLLNLWLTGNLRRSQGLIRPDYATAPRLSAQMSALRGVAHGLDRGALFRNPAALDRLAAADVIVFDESAGLDRQRVQVAKVESVKGVSAQLAVGYAVAAYQSSPSEQGRALAAAAEKGKSVHPQTDSVRHFAGVTRYRDRRGRVIEIATSGYLAASKLEIPQGFQPVLAENGEPSLRPLWVVRDERVIGVVSFARSGEALGAEVVARLLSQKHPARIVYLSRSSQAETEALAQKLGIRAAHGGLSPAEKVELIRGLGGKALWIGDGSAPDAREAIVASSVSISVAPLSRVHEEAADILLPREGLSVVPQVIAIGRGHVARLARDYRTVYTVNLLGVAGAFIANFNGLHSGLLSNFGTGLIYVRHARALDRLAAAAEKRRAQLKRVAVAAR